MSPSPFQVLRSAFVSLLLFLCTAAATRAQFSFSDNAGNYGGTWANGNNFGTGYNAWTISTTGGNAGTFIGNPASNGMGTAGIGTTAFGVFGHSGNTVNAVRFFGAGGTNVPMQIGDVFSFHWAMNFDAGGGFKGFDLRAGGTMIFNVNNGGSATITTSNGNANTVYGTDAMLVTLTRTSWTQYSFTMTSRSGGATYSTTISSAADINNINIYCGNQPDNLGQRNIYFNNFNFTKAEPYETNFSLTDPRIMTGTSNLTKTGTGNLTLSGVNTFSGNTIVNANSLLIANDNNFGTAPGVATANKIQIGAGTLGITGTITINANRGMTLNNAASTVDVAAGQTATYNGIIAGTGGLTKTGTGTLLLGGANTYSGTTTVSAGILRLGAAGVIPDASNVVMSGGTLSTGATTGNAETAGTLQLTASSTLALGTGVHNVVFANSSAVSWTANTLLTITGWTGTNNGNSSGTAGRVFVGNGFGGLTGVQLSRIRFNISSVLYGAMQLSTGEIVPTGGTVLYYGGATGTWTGNLWGTAEGGPYTSAWTSGAHAVFNIASANTLTFGTTNVSAITYNENITYAAGGTFGTGPAGGAICPIFISTGRTLTLAGQGISTTAGSGLIKNGPGILQSTNGNNYTGGFTQNEGLTAIGGVNALGNGGSLTLNGGTLAGTANRDLSGRYTGGITIGGNFTLGSSTAPASGTATLTFTNNTALGSSTTRTITLGGTGLMTWNGIISGTGSNLILDATAAGTLALGGVNTYGGNTTINGGSLRPTVAGALPTTTGLSFGNVSGAILDLQTNGLGHTVVSLSGGGTTGGNIAFGAATTTSLTINQSTNTTYSGQITGASLTSGGLVKTGAGVLTLANASNSYAGTTTITGGELRLNPVANATFASQIVLNGGTLSTTGITATRTWTSSSTLNLNANSTLALGSGDHTLTFANSSAVTWAGTTLTITGWTGTGGSSGTGGKIIVGAGGLTGAQLAKISFSGFPGTPIILAGELVPPAAGISYTWDGSNSSSWTDPANWTPGTSVAGPTASDNVIIPDAGSYTNALSVTGSQSTFDFTVNANGTYAMAAGSSLTIGGTYTYSSSTAPTFDCSSTLNISGSTANTIPAHTYGNLNISGGARTLASSGTIGICGTYTQGSPMTITGSTINYLGTGAQTIGAGSYNNLTISNARGSANLTLPAGTISVAGTFDVSTLSAFTPVVNAASIFDFVSAGAQTIPAFFYGQLSNTGNGNRTWASSGIIDINQGFAPGTGTHTITGSTVRYSNTSATTWNLTTFLTNLTAPARQYNNLIFNGGATTIWSQNGITLGVAGNLNVTSGTLQVGSTGGAGTLNVDGNLAIDGANGTLNLSASTNPNTGTINLLGNFNISAGTFNKSGAATGTFNFARTSLTQTISQSGGTITNNGTTWNLGTGSTTQTIEFSTNISIGGGTVIANNNATIDFLTTSVLSGSTTFTTVAGTTLRTGNVAGFNHTAASGSVQCTTRPFNVSGVRYIFNGTSAQQTGTGLNPSNTSQTIASLTIDNPAGVTLSSSGGTGNGGNAVIVTGTVTLTQGILTLDTRDLQMNPGSSFAGAPFDATKMIVTIGTSNRNNGRLLRIFPATTSTNSTFTYPLGDNTGTAEYTPFVVTDLDYATAGGGPFIAIKVKDNKAPFDPALDNYLTRTFEITTGTSFTGASAINFTFTAGYITGASDVLGNDNLFRVNRFSYTTGTWTEDAGSSCGSGTLTSAALNSAALFNDHDITGKLTAPIYFRSNVASSGNWEDPSSWLASTDVNFAAPAGVVPSIYPIFSNSEGIRIMAGDSITVTTLAAFGGIPLDQASVDAGAKLIISPTAILTVQNGTGTDLTVDGSLVNRSSAASVVVGTIEITATGVYEHRTNAGTIPACTWTAGSLCYITGTTATAPSGFTGQSFSDLTWNTPSLSTGISLSSGLSSARDVIIHNTGSSNLGLTATTALNATFRNVTINSSSFLLMATGGTTTNNVTVNVTQNLTLNGGGLTVASSGASGTGTRSFTVAGNVTNNSTAGTSIVVNAGSGTVGFSVGDSYTQNNTSGSVSVNQGSGIGNFVVQNDFTLTSGNFYLNNGGTGSATLTQNATNRNFTVNGGTLALIQTATAPSPRPLITIGGNFIQGNGNIEFSTAYTGGLNPPGEIRVARNFTRSGTGYIRNTSASNNALILFNGTSTYNSTSTGNFTYTNVTVNTGDTLTLGSNLTFSQSTASPSQTLTVNGRLDCGTNVVGESAAGATFNVPATGTLVMGSLAGITSSGATGNIQTTTRTFGVANYVYTGNNNQASGNGLPASIASLTVANSGTAPNNVLTLDNNSSASGALTFTSGMLSLGANTLTVGSVSGASATQYVRTASTGRLRQVVAATPVTFPVGNSAYNPITLTNTGTSDTYGVLVLDVITSPAPNDATLLINRYWDVNEAVAGGSNLAITATYNSGEEGVNFATGSTLYMGNFPVSSWNQNGATSSGSGPFNVSSSTNFSTVGTFGIGKDNGFINPVTVYTWTGLGAAGSWADPNNWNPNTSVAGPLPGDDIIINAPGSGANNLNITGAQTIANVTFNGTGVLNMASGGSLTINGTTTYGGSFVANLNCNSTITYNNPASLNIPPLNYGNLAHANGSVRTWTASATTGICGTLTTGTGSTFTAGAGSTVNYNGTGAQTIVPLAYANLSISNNRGAANLTSPSGTISVSGTFDVSTLSNYTPAVDPASIFDFTAAGTQTIPAFFYGQLNNSGNGARTWASSGVIDIAQGFNPGSGTQTITGSTIRYSNTAAGTWNLTNFTTNVAGRQYNNLEFVGGASTVWQPGTAFNFGVAGNLTLSGAGRLIANPNSSIVTWTVDGNVVNSGSGNITLSNSTGTTNFNVTGNTTLGTGGGTLTVVGASTGAGLTTTFTTNDLTISGTASMNLDAASNTAAATVTVNGNVSVTSTVANAINLGSGTNNANNIVNVRGNFTKSGTGTLGLSGTYNATAIYNFNGPATQTWNHSGTAMAGGGITVASGSTLQLATNLVSASSANANPINIAGELDCQGFAVTASNTSNTFSLNSTGTIRTSSASGIAGAVTGFTPAPGFASGGTFIFTGTNVNTGFAGFTNITTGSQYTITWLGSTSLTLDKTMNLNAFNFTNAGLVNLGNFSISLPSSAGALTGTGFGVGKMFVTNGTGVLHRAVLSSGTGLPFTWPIGEITGTTEYSPVTISSIALAGINGTIGFRVVDGVHPDMALATSYLSRYWPCTVTGFNAAYTLGSSTFTYDSGTDVVVGPEGSLRGNSFNSTTADWSQYASSTAGSNVLTITSGLGGATMPTAGPGTYDITGRIDVPVYYRSVNSGPWSTASNWEISSDPLFVTPPPVTPVNPPSAANSDSILIRNTHTINVTATHTGDEIAVKTGGILSITTGGNFTVPNGPGATDVRVDGALWVATPFTISSGARVFVTNQVRQAITGQIVTTGTLQVGATGTYIHATASGASVVPTATWDAGSTCLLQYAGSTLPTGLNQAFHHVTLDADPGSIGAAGNLNNIGGNLTLLSTGANNLVLGAGTNYTINVGGNVDVRTGAGLDVQSGSGTSAINITGNLLQAAASLITRSGGGTFTWTVNGNFEQSGGTFQLNVPSSAGVFNLRGNLVNNGTINAPSGTRNWNFVRTTGVQTISQTGGSIANAFIWNVGDGTTTNTLQLTSNVNLGISGAGSFFINGNATIDFQAFVLSGSSTGADAFRMQNNARLITANTAGITTSGATGSVQVAGTRTYTGASNNNQFTYNSTSSNQVVGNGLPTTMAALSINNTGGAGNNTVSLPNATYTIGTLNLQAGLLDQSLGNIIISNSGSVNGSGGNFATTSLAFVTFQGSNVVNGTVGFRNCEANGSVNFGLLSTVNNTFRINGGGSVSTNGPTYASGSTLNYATNGNYDRGLEWNPISGRGAPHHVLVSGTNTNLNPARTGASYAGIAFNTTGDVTINTTCGIYLDFGGNNMTVPLNIGGTLTLIGGLSGSNSTGGDINVAGDWLNNGTATNFFPNGRQVAFNGAAAQVIGGTNAINIPFAFLAISNTGGNVTTNRPITVNNRLQMNSGLLILGNNNLVLAPGCEAMTTGTETSYVVTDGTGVFRQQVPNNALDRWFPMGPSTTVFGPITLNQAVSGTTDNIDVRVVVAPAFTTAVNDNLQMVNLEWRLTEGVAGGNRLTNTYGWRTASEATNFLRDEAVYVGNHNGTRYVFQGTVNPLGGSNPWFAETTPAQPFTGNLSPTRAFVVGNINGIVPCFQTAGAGDWNTGATWVGGVVPPTDALTCISHNLTCTATPTDNPGGINLQPGGNLTLSAGATITLTNDAPIINSSGSVRNLGSGTIQFSGLGLVSGGNAITFNNLQINGNTTFSTVPTINGNFEILPGGFVISSNGPNYAPTSTLIYNTGGTYGRFNEWRSTSGAGYPANVLVTGNTTLNLDNGTGVNRAIQGNMQIDNGSAVSQGATSFGLIVPGNFTLNGTYTQSTTFGGDLVLGGNWVSASTAVLNANNRDVRFNGNSGTQTISNLAAGLQFGFLTIDNTGTGVDLLNTITTNTFRVNAGRTFNLTTDQINISSNGNVLINGIFNANAGTIQYQNGGNFTNNGTFNRGTSTVDFLPNATFNGLVTGSAQTNFHNIYMGSFSGIDFNSGAIRGRVSGVFQLRNGSFVFGNSPIYEPGSKLMYSGGGTFNRNVEWDPTTLQKVEVRNNTILKCGSNGTGFSHVMADSLIIQSGSTFDMSGPDMTQPTVVGGSVLLRGTLTLSNAAGGDIRVAGDWNNNGGTFNCNGRLTTFDGSLDASLNGPTATTFCLLTVNKNITKTLTATAPVNVTLAAGTEVRVAGGVFNLNGQTLTASGASNTLRINAGFTNGQTLRTGGASIAGFTNYTSDGVTTATLGGKVDYSGTGPETYTSAVTTYNLLWNTGGSTKTLPQTTVVQDSLWIAPSTTVDFAATAFNLQARGHVVNNGSTVGSGTGSVILDGSATQNMSGNGSYRNLEVNNTNNVNSSGKPTITSKLNVLLGKVQTGSDTIILGPSATISETIGAGEHFVRGNLKTTRVVGTAASTFGGMGVELTAGSDLGTVVVNRKSGVALQGSSPCCTGFSSIQRSWTITPSIQPVSADRDLTLSWPSQDDNALDMTILQLWKRSLITDPWEDIGPVQNVSAANPRVAVWTGVTGFSEFTGGDLNNPLPLSLISFSGRLDNGMGLLTWTMGSENGLARYVVEKSTNGKDFSEIGSLSARQNGSAENRYQFTDRNLNQDSYYRIRLVYESGKTDKSNTIRIRPDAFSAPEFKLHPNPASNWVELSLDGATSGEDPLQVRVLGTDGRELMVLEGTLQDLNPKLSKLTASLSAGVYQIQVRNDHHSKTLRLIKK